MGAVGIEASMATLQGVLQTRSHVDSAPQQQEENAKALRDMASTS